MNIATKKSWRLTQNPISFAHCSNSLFRFCVHWQLTEAQPQPTYDGYYSEAQPTSYDDRPETATTIQKLMPCFEKPSRPSETCYGPYSRVRDVLDNVLNASRTMHTDFCVLWHELFVPTYYALRCECSESLAEKMLASFYVFQQIAHQQNESFNCTSENGQVLVNMTLASQVFAVDFDFEAQNAQLLINPPTCGEALSFACTKNKTERGDNNRGGSYNNRGGSYRNHQWSSFQASSNSLDDDSPQPFDS